MILIAKISYESFTKIVLLEKGHNICLEFVFNTPTLS